MKSKARARVHTFDGGAWSAREDALAGEEPLEIRVKSGGGVTPVTVTMRTPGHDFELAVGFLFAEGVVRSRDEVRRVTYCADAEQKYNTVNVELDGGESPFTLPRRNFFASSACGVCGTAALEDLRSRGLEPLPGGFTLTPQLLCRLPDRLRAAQRLFDATGGLHAAALFDASGALLCLREDIGRHNAVDKVVGWALMSGARLGETALLVSGRAGYEVVQKAVAARIPLLASVSAPSSLAVRLGREYDLTLVGFLRGERFNVYSGRARLL